MTIPKLVFADSALWMWLDKNRLFEVWAKKDGAICSWRDEYFTTDPTTDYNN